MRVLETEQALKGSRLWNEIPPPVAETVRAKVHVRHYEQGEIMYRVGDPIPGAAYLESGLVARYATDEPLPHQRALVRWPGEVCTMTLSGETEWPVSVVALTPVIWMIAPFQVFQQMVGEHPGFAAFLVQRLARQNYREHSWLARLASATLRPRLRLIIHRLAQELGTSQRDGTLLDFRTTHELLAAIARANRDEVGRAVRELIAHRLIVRRPNWRLLVPDLAELLIDTDG